MLQIRNLSKAYKTKGGVVTRALDDVSVDFPERGLVFLLGKSGSGKSTLLNMIGGLDRPDSGEVIVKGRSSKDFSQSDFDSYRNTYVGFIFQEYNVLNEFNIEQNIALALQLQGKKNDKAAVDALLKEVDLEGFNKRKPNTLSGGQKQRIAIARALIKDPEIIMADEPTGALDSATGKQVLEILKKLSQTKLVIIVSHDQDFAEEYGDRIIELKDGKIISDKTKEYVAPKTINENVTVINENVIDIKEAGKLSDADIKEICALLKKQKGEILISSGEGTVQATKKAARVGESNHSEVFADTKKVDIKEYNGNETKFIRSRMPFARALKMGASSLKTKPIRLTFTILLSVVSMTLFGVASTLMLYRPAYSLSMALENCERTSEAINKSYKYKSHSITINNATGETTDSGSEWEYSSETFFGRAELEELNAQTNNKFIGVFNYYPGTHSYSSDSFRFKNIAVPTESSDYYSSARSFFGVSDASSSWFSQNGFEVRGQLPTKDNEVAVSNYIYDFIKASGSLGTINSYNDLLGKALEFNTFQKGAPNKLTITGVIDFGPLPSKFDALKEAKPASQNEMDRQKEVSAFQSVISSSVYTTGFVAPSFFDKYATLTSASSNYDYLVDFRGVVFNDRPFYGDEGKDISQDDFYENGYIFDDMNKPSYDFYNLSFEETEVPQLKDDEVILPYENYYSNYAYSKYVFEVNEAFNIATNIDNNDPAFVSFTEDYWSENPQSDLSKALKRLSDGSNSSFQRYEEDHTPEEDKAFAVTELRKFIARGYELSYLRKTTDLIDHYINFNAVSAPEGWESEEMIALREALYNGSAYTDAQMSALKSKLQTIIEADSNMAYIPAVAFIEGPLYEAANWNNYSEMNELSQTYNYANYHEMVNAARDSGYSSSSVATLKSFAKALYKSLYGADILDSDFGSFYSGINLIEPIYRSEDNNLPEKIYSRDYTGAEKTYTVKGYYRSNTGNGGWGKVFTRNAIKQYLIDSYSWKEVRESDYVEPTDARYSFLLAATSYSLEDIELFTKDHGSYSYSMSNDIYVQVNMYTEMITTLKTVFLIVGGVTGVLAGLLLLNFISVSIASKSKDIGILRAVGARGSDVFKIFYSESSIIAAICFVLSVIGTGLVCFFMNREMVNSLLGIPLLEFGALNVLMVLGISIVFSFVATFLPVMLAAKKPPVEAIRAL